MKTDGEVLRGATAVLFVYQQLGYPVGLATRPPCLWVADIAYRVIASNRILASKFFFRDE